MSVLTSGPVLVGNSATTTRPLSTILGDFRVADAYGAAVDGTTNDYSAWAAAISAVQSAGGGSLLASSAKSKTSGSALLPNHVYPTSMAFDRPTVAGFLDGSVASPSAVNADPVFWVQKVTSYDTGDQFAHNCGGVFSDVYVKGTGSSASPARGTWISQLGNAVIAGTNTGSSGAPAWDTKGNIIGVAGFARQDGYPGDGGITCGLWAYSTTPSMDATTFSNLPSGKSFATTGLEINVESRHPDPGYRANVSGHGSIIGGYVFNYRTPGNGVRDWTFGFAFNGTPDDGNYSSQNVDNYNGFHTAILIDKVKDRGIDFGMLFKDGSYGIAFPAAFAGSQEPAAGIFMGGAKLNLGTYMGSTYNDQDVWYNSGRIFFHYNGQNERLLTDRFGVTMLSALHTFSLNGGFGLQLVSVVNAVNYFVQTNAVTGSAPIVGVGGSDTNVSLELRTKGTGYLFTTSPLYFRPGTSITPPANGDVGLELTNDTTLTVRARGSDGTVRSVALTLT